MSAMSPIVPQDDISATSAALPSEDHYTSANETLKGPGMAAGTHIPRAQPQSAGALGPATNRCSFQ